MGGFAHLLAALSELGRAEAGLARRLRSPPAGQPRADGRGRQQRSEKQSRGAQGRDTVTNADLQLSTANRQGGAIVKRVAACAASLTAFLSDHKYAVEQVVRS